MPDDATTATDFIQPDSKDSTDEDYHSGGESSTASLSSTIFAYEYENGRRYHAYKAGTYAIPNDETEQERYDAPDPSLDHFQLKLSSRAHKYIDWTSCITFTACSSREGSMWHRCTNHSGYSISARELESGPLI
jgi:hypothetical protein